MSKDGDKDLNLIKLITEGSNPRGIPTAKFIEVFHTDVNHGGPFSLYLTLKPNPLPFFITHRILNHS